VAVGSSGPPRAGLPLPVVRLVLGMSIAALACLAMSSVFAARGPAPVWWQFGLTVGLFATGSVAVFTVRVGSQHIDVVWTEAALAVGLTLLPLGWMLPAVALGAVLAFGFRPSQPVKAVFNVAMDVVTAALAVLLVGALRNPHADPKSARELAVVVLAAAVSGHMTDIATTVAVGLSQQRSIVMLYRSQLAMHLTSLVGNLAGTVFVLALVRYDPKVLVVLPALLLCLRQAYLGRQRGREERDSWQGLLEATRALADLDERTVLSRGVAAAAKLFSADWVEVEYTGGRLVRGTEHGTTYDGPAAEALPMAAHTIQPRPLGPDNAALGTLRLCFRGEVALQDRERAMLGAVAAELHSALVNARQHAKARHEATHDPLTDLLNRAGLLEAGRQPLLTAATGGMDAAVVLVDLTGFREIVDTLGHTAGDTVLRYTARRLRAAAMPGELLARLDSDDFVVLLPRLTDPAQASHRAEMLLGALAEPVEIDGASLSISGVAGIAYAVRGSVALEELLRQAGVAVHAVRAGSGGRVGFYAPERDAGSVTRLVLASELRTALRDMEQLELLYQPIVDLHSGEAVGAEALVRWNHPTRGQLGPREFLPVVEHAGLLPELTRRVFDIALENAAEWSRHGIDVPVAVDVSPRTLVDRDFPGQLAAALSRHRVPPSRLTLEITETSVLTHLDVVNRVLGELNELGVRLALDHFGEGYSSLSRLSRVTVHAVKLAPDFADLLFTSSQAAAVVRGTLEIARALDLQVVAEGVSTAMQRATLVSLGCHSGQGPHFFPPLSAHKIGAALWSSAMRAMAASEGADVIPLSQRRTTRRES
jgi:diguanylate cyclase (GGDEF)-like protein